MFAFSIRTQAADTYNITVSTSSQLNDYLSGNACSNYSKVIVTLNNDINVSQRITVGSKVKTIVLYGNGHTLTNSIKGTQCMLYIPSGVDFKAYDLKLDGNKKLTDGNSCGSLAVSNEGTCYMENVTICSCYNYSLQGGSDGGGTGFENLTGTMYLKNCYATDCYGAAFWNGNSKKNKAGNLTLEDCSCTDSAGGAYNAYDGKMLVIGGSFKTGGKSYSLACCNEGSGDLTIKNNPSFYASNGLGLDANSTGNTTVESGDFQGFVGINHPLGSLVIQDCYVHDSVVGINAYSKIEQTGGYVRNCYINTLVAAEYRISGNTSFGTENGSNIISLKKDGNLYVTNKLSSDFIGAIVLEDSEKYVGKTLVTTYSINAKVNNDIADKFSLLSNEILYNNDKSAFTGVKDSAAIRVADGHNGKIKSLILSAKYYAKYHDALEYFNEKCEGMNFHSDDYKDTQEFYYEEPFCVFTKEGQQVVTVLDNNGQKVKYIENVGYSLKSKYLKDKNNPQFNDGALLRRDKNVDLYAVYNLNAVVRFYGNGGSKYLGDGQEIKATSQGEIYIEEKLKDDIISLDYGYFRSEQDGENTVKYKFLGWSLKRTTKYNDSDYIACKTKVKDLLDCEYIDYILRQYSSGVLKTTDEGVAVIPVYAVWDQYPVISANDTYIFKSDFSLLSENYIINRCNAKAQDKEDGSLQIAIENYNKEDFLNLQDNEYLEIKFVALDGAGNMSEHISKIYYIDDMSNAKVRFIDEDNYNKRNSTADKGNSKGALSKNSVWYLDQDYVKAIKTALAGDSKESSCYYNRDQIKEYNL